VIAPSDSRVLLFVDDDLRRRHFVVEWIPRAYLAHSPVYAIETIQRLDLGRHPRDIIFLDWDLGAGIDSAPIAKYLAETRFPGRVICHSENPFGWASIQQIFHRADIIPFSLLARQVREAVIKSACATRNYSQTSRQLGSPIL
jgi:hypothetical protein